MVREAACGDGSAHARHALLGACEDLHDRRAHHDEEQDAEDDLPHLAPLLLLLAGAGVLAHSLLILVALEAGLAGSGHRGEEGAGCSENKSTSAGWSGWPASAI